jgi:hypothetical protein
MDNFQHQKSLVIITLDKIFLMDHKIHLTNFISSNMIYKKRLITIGKQFRSNEGID